MSYSLPSFSALYVPSPEPPPSAARGVGAALVGLIVLVFASKYMCKQVSADERLGHPDGSHTAAASAARRRPPPQEPRDGARLHGALDPPPRPRLPAFVYSRPSLQNKAAADITGEEAATCPVCLGAFELGEMVRLLPVCLHLYHVECIDPWLGKHSTCPVCRSETDQTQAMDLGQLPPV